MLISLPFGLLVSGITTWAFRLADSLARAGRRVVIVAHPEPPGFAALTHDLHHSIEVTRTPSRWGSIDADGETAPYVQFYRDVVRRLAAESSRPVVCLPNLSASSYGFFAALAMTDPEAVRVVAWTHNHVEHDLRLVEYFEPCLARIVGVSQAITADLKRRVAWRDDDIENVPHGVSVSGEYHVRQSLVSRPLRLIYTGRMENSQKRASSLIALSDELVRRKIDHRMLLVGDGPTAAEIDHATTSRPSVRRTVPESGTRSHEVQIAGWLRDSDVFVLPSRYEGLSVSMLEAMGQGCVPIVTDVSSGAREAIRHRENGLLVPIPEDASDATVASAFADAIVELNAKDIQQLGRSAWQAARDNYSLSNHITQSHRVIEAAAESKARTWPANRACIPSSATDSKNSMFSVPPDAGLRASRALGSLKGKRVALWGAGKHTLALSSVLAECPAHIVGIIDDDPARRGTHLWGYPIMSPSEVRGIDIDAVVISSWMHEPDMWLRRERFTSQGIEVVRLYERESRVETHDRASSLHKNEAGRELISSGTVTVQSQRESITRAL